MRNQSNPLDLQWKAWDLVMGNQSIGFAMESMRFGYEKSIQSIGITMENMRFEYEKSIQSIGFTMENMRFEYEKSPEFIGFALKTMRFCMRNKSKPLDLEWKSWDLVIQDGFHDIWAAISWSDWDWTYISHQPWVLSWWSWSHWWSLQWAWCIFYGRWGKWGSSWELAMMASEHCSSLHWGPSRITWVDLVVHLHHQLMAICLLGVMSMWIRTWGGRFKN